MKSKGFTLIELIIVIVIIGTLGAIAISAFYNLQSQARETTEENIISSIISGIKGYGLDSVVKNRTPIYPATLDDAAIGAASNTNMFFTNVLQLSGITNDEWSKISQTVYLGPSGSYYNYDPLEGSFLEFTPGGGGGGGGPEPVIPPGSGGGSVIVGPKTGGSGKLQIH